MGMTYASPAAQSVETLTRLQWLGLKHREAEANEAFIAAAARADNRRQDHDWQDAQSTYWIALNICPIHAATRTDYAGVLLEQNNLVWAEINYRSALAEGGDVAHIDAMMKKVMARATGGNFAEPPPGLDVPAMQAPPTWHDLEMSQKLLWHEGKMTEDEVLHHMRHSRTIETLLSKMIDDDRFRRRNLELVEMVGRRS